MSNLVALVPASGTGSRMASSSGTESISSGPIISNSSLPNGAPTKLFILLKNGRPLFIEAISSLFASGCISKVILPVNEKYLSLFEEHINKHLPDLPIHLLIGGNTRQESVLAAFNSLSSSSDLPPSHILIHDAARPYPNKNDIIAVCSKAKETGAAILAAKVTSTVKLAVKSNNSCSTIDKTLDRENIWLAQTPQVFETKILRKAYDKAEKDNFIGTDESSLVENIQQEVSLVESSGQNTKITYLSDLEEFS